MVVIPMNRTPNPRITIPMFCIFCLLQNIYITTPAITNSGASAERLKEINWEVTVVPMFAPMMIPIACDSFMMPEFTKPTTMTVVAEDDWITAVTPAPSNTALNGIEDRLSKIRSNFQPDIFSRPPPITLIPYRNIARPPIIVRIPKIFIISPLHRHILGYCLHFDSIL